MSRIVYFDCASGASGDMLLGAVVDLGLPIDRLREELAKLPLPGYRLEARGVTRSGLAATKVDVVAEGPSPAHRHLRHILELLEASGLEAEVKARAAALFRRLAEAEAAVHGTSVEKVHFHEVGAVDSIVDIVGGVIALRWLAARRFVASPLNVGTGTVTMSHGTFPVPPPATAKLVAGVPVYGEGEGELLTPTGALLVTAHATEYGPLPPMRIEATGHGAGGRETKGRPNVLRLIVGEEEARLERGPRPRARDRARRRRSPAPRPAPRSPAGAGRARRLLHPRADEEGPARRPRHGHRRGVEARGPRGAALPGDDDARRAAAGVGPHRPRARDASPSRPPTGRSVSRSAAGARRSTTRGPSSTTASGRPPRRAWR